MERDLGEGELRTHSHRDIIIAPRMSFGSGHHQTTRMMCRLIRELCSGGRVLDVGCGTGVLSIAAVHCGAEHVDAVDIDPWSVDSAQEDMIVANINRNIILADLDRYLAALNRPSKLLLSGFLREDMADIREACQVRGLRYVTHREEDGWIAMAMER